MTVTTSTDHTDRRTPGYVQVLPDDIGSDADLRTVASEYGLTYEWGEAVDDTGAHEVVEFRGAVADLQVFVDRELGGEAVVLQ